MGEELKAGDLVMLTRFYDEYVHRRNPTLNTILTNRLAKIEEIIDWNSPKGRFIRDARVKSGKWQDLPIEENKYLMSVYYPDLTGRKGQKGVVERGLAMFRCDPKSGAPFFEKVPDWLYQEIQKKCETFMVGRVDVPG